jgi:hypothetical protein
MFLRFKKELNHLNHFTISAGSNDHPCGPGGQIFDIDNGGKGEGFMTRGSL